MAQVWSKGLGLAILLSGFAQTHGARAQGADATALEGATPAPSVGQRNFGVLASIGSFSGFGGGIQAGTDSVGLRLIAGWNPLLMSIQEPGDDTPSLKFFSGWVASPDLYVSLFQSKKGAHAGAQVGYRYDSQLKHGFAIGGYGSMRISYVLDGFVEGGFVVYPNGTDELKDEREDELPAGVDFGFPGPSVSFAISLGLALFP